MRLISFEEQGQARIGVLTGPEAHSYVDLALAAPQLGGDMTRLLAQSAGLDAARQAAAKASASVIKPLAGTRFLPVVPHPGKVICLGLNYADHAKEGGHARPDYPSFFLRGASSLGAHLQPIIRPKASTRLDYEAELAVVIGRKARHLSKASALDCVAGYTCCNDGSVRDYQRKSSQWTIGKNFDQTGPLGPWLVTPEELPPGCAGLRIQSRLNGQVMQNANTTDFLWNVVEALVIITECMTLEPGDVIITGTPAGVGYARTPPVWMAPGDICEIDIEGIGVLSNPIADEA